MFLIPSTDMVLSHLAVAGSSSIPPLPTTTDEDIRKRLVGYLGSNAAASIAPEDEASLTKYDVPEVDVYLHLLVMIYLLDQSQLEKVPGRFLCCQ